MEREPSSRPNPSRPSGEVLPGDGIDVSTLSAFHRAQRTYNGTENNNVTGPLDGISRSGNATPSQYLPAGFSWAYSRRFDANDILSDLNTSWAGEFSCMLTDMASPMNTSLETQTRTAAPYSGISVNGPPNEATSNLQQAVLQNSAHSTTQLNSGAESWEPKSPAKGGIRTTSLSPGHPELETGRTSSDESTKLIHLFQKIVQPPAAILIGGIERWRRLQRYLCKLSDQSRAVSSSLLCVVELLMIEDLAAEPGQSRDALIERIMERHADACHEISRKLAKHPDLNPKTREHLLAAVFLLSWFEVIRDQDSQSSLFPRDLAEIIITADTNWNRHSQQLLSWLNTLDSKATHLGGQHLLLPRSLEIVSHYQPQITSEQCHDDLQCRDPNDSELSWDDMSPEDSHTSHHSPDDVSLHAPMLKLGKVKQIMLNTMLQPALEWYLTSQAYCRRISAHDKHHRKRLTSDDEYEVITACKQLELELFELWDYRPAIISIAAEQLKAIVSPDVATRLEEVFSVYLASFWILFVYLHRVSWWNFPHSTLTTRALGEVWLHLQRAYGEEVNGPLRRIIHPSLLWPLFLFGCECPDPVQRSWAIEQLEALGEAKATLRCDVDDTQTLPPFKLGSGATRNAQRAATLLRELIKEQDEKNMRVDDRDLSMKMFGCYFSIV
ncbi:C6 finger domain-containing protein [Pochonia chlamydosporia 170]|uniref:C6 finger domain-containing protein n=1 Tax=Pochonia chlamydosporia 170 TaxID=1380566 RepID=A0A179FF38_METCM|nr:C6 finger domain-containing protein [Pochonia chlamydosporia 170]OAQ63669.1 C6 finger domain-containing protein [Pochonia chlamydosporia 170]